MNKERIMEFIKEDKRNMYIGILVFVVLCIIIVSLLISINKKIASINYLLLKTKNNY